MMKKLQGNISGFMIGMVIAVGLTSTLTAKQFKSENEKREQEFIKQKKEAINTLNNNMRAVLTSGNATNSNTTLTDSHILKGTYTNIFNAENNQANRNTKNSSGTSKNLIYTDENEKNKQDYAYSSSGNILSKDLSGSHAALFNEETLRKEQIAKSYNLMKKQARMMYNDVLGSADFTWADSYSNYATDTWGRNFTYTKIDDINAQLAFNLPWNTSDSRVLSLRLPASPTLAWVLKETISPDPDESWSYTAFNTYQSVDMDNDTIIIGNPENSDAATNAGAVYFYDYNRNTDTLTRNSVVYASDPQNYQKYGKNTAISGDYAITGDNSAKGAVTYLTAGAAYIMKKNGSTWEEDQKIYADDGGSSDRFGESVDIHGKYAIVGSYNDDDLGSNSGTAYIFERQDNGTWSQEVKLTAPDGVDNDQFGKSVAISENYALVNSPYHNAGVSNQGAVYIYKRSGSNWNFLKKLVAPDPVANDYIGFALAINDKHAIIGAHNTDDTHTGSGSVYVFTNNSDSWDFQEKLLPSKPSTLAKFGISVSLYDNKLAVGASTENSGSLGDGIGRIYLYEDGGSSWNKVNFVDAFNTGSAYYFGRGVALKNDIMAVVEPGGNNDTYEVHIYEYE